MPIYEYKCTKGHVFDVIQKMADDALTECQECGAPAERVLHPVAVHFKGSGFYTTDYGKKKAVGNGGGSSESKESKSSDSKSSASGESKSSGDSKGSGATADSAASTGPSSGTAE